MGLPFCSAVFPVIMDSMQLCALWEDVCGTRPCAAQSEALAFVFLLGKDFQGSKLKVSLTRKKGPMNSMRGGMPPRDQRGMPPPSAEVLGGLEAQGGPVGRAVPWAGWEAEVATGEASPPEDHGDPGETPLGAACSTVLGTGSAPIRKYCLPSLHTNTTCSRAAAPRGCRTIVLHLSMGLCWLRHWPRHAGLSPNNLLGLQGSSFPPPTVWRVGVAAPCCRLGELSVLQVPTSPRCMWVLCSVVAVQHC